MSITCYTGSAAQSYHQILKTFHGKFHAAATAGQEELDGKSGEKPIHLDGMAREMFELFLEHTFGRARLGGQYTIDELSTCINALIPGTSSFPIQANPHRFHPSQLITLAAKCRARENSPHAFKRLVDTPIAQLTAHHRELFLFLFGGTSWLETTGFWQLTKSVPVGPLRRWEFHPSSRELQPVKEEMRLCRPDGGTVGLAMCNTH
ncbi:hypothetical protein K503DRAFT_40014 [Rhizopogon vinicolor AM-OR11-026]|uniref:Uncharacterized protein n=1 Tax=Rhizopogon vinicolor AM-OR11-026 TaxID=1314800 RepID=A0A1B7N517_9AGAM|nr:hypothetical protein K503DRAFT_40014 [Rhizopogon vinicolor AM-OR11-026]